MTPHDSTATNKTPSAATPKRNGFRRLLLPLGALVILLIIAGLAFPAIGSRCLSSRVLADASNLRQAGVLCHLYAGDYDGQFPVQFTTNGVNITNYEGWPPTQNSNEAFRALFAEGYTRVERTFHSDTDYYDGQGCFLKGDDKIGTEASHFQEALAPGECSYIYFAGLSKSSESSMPLACNAVRGSITYEPGKGWVARDLYLSLFDNGTTINKKYGINVLRVDGSVDFVPAQSDGTVLLGGINDEQATQVRVVYPLMSSLFTELTAEDKKMMQYKRTISGVFYYIQFLYQEIIRLITHH